MLDKEFEYRLFSAVAHGQQWALLELGFVVAPKGHNDPQTKRWNAIAQNTQLLQQQLIAPNHLVGLTGNVATVVSKPFWGMCQIFGWETNEAKDLLERNFNSLRIKDDQHFWR
jgi:hypothetical protein